MKNKIIRVFSLLLVLIAAVSVVSLPAFALEWDGDSSDGGGHGTSAGPNGYGIASVNWDNCVGYRFSLIDKDGENKVTKVIDVIRNSHFGKEWQSTPKVLPGELHEQRSLVDYSPRGCKESDITE